MSRQLIVFLVMMMAAFSSPAFSLEAGKEEALKQEAVEEVDAAAVVVDEAQVPAEPVVINNKICPISKEPTNSMGDGFKVAYNGKTYNLCCEMCAKDFNKDPEKYIQLITEEMEKEAVVQQ